MIQYLFLVFHISFYLEQKSNIIEGGASSLKIESAPDEKNPVQRRFIKLPNDVLQAMAGIII